LAKELFFAAVFTISIANRPCLLYITSSVTGEPLEPRELMADLLLTLPELLLLLAEGPSRVRHQRV
jgi:hypothetical protein